MSETKWTKGAWSAKSVGKLYLDYRIKAGHKDVAIINFCNTFEEETANASLIAAAPNLYEALSHLICEIEDCAQPCDWDAFEPALKALAKARGE